MIDGNDLGLLYIMNFDMYSGALSLVLLGKHMQILAHAASGYRKVLEENRKLYNQVQDLKGDILAIS